MATANIDLPPPSLVDLLFEGMNALDLHAPCFHGEPHFTTTLQQQRDSLRYIYERHNIEGIPVTAQYRMLYPFMAWFNRNTGSSYIALSQREPMSLLFLLQFYSAFILLVIAMPSTDTPFFVSFRVRAVLELVLALGDRQEAVCHGCSKVHDYRQVVAFSLNVIRLYKQHRRARATQLGLVLNE
jgi:hypothetical protein